jgi:twinkle protein
MRPRTISSEDVPEWDGQYGDAKRKIVHASLLAEKMLESIRGDNPELIGDLLPWSKTHGDVQFRSGEVTLWVGYSGHRKSMLLGQVATGFHAQKRSTVMASFEMQPFKSLRRMVLQAAGTKDPSDRFVREFCENVRVWFYDHVGLAAPEQVYGLIRYSDTFGIRHVIVDSMMKVVANEDDYNGQKEFVNTCCALAQAQGIHIHIVHHARKGVDESVPPGKMDAKGTGGITDQADNVIVVWMNKAKERDILQGNKVDEMQPDAMLIVEKQRNGEYEGRIKLWLHRESCQFMGAPNQKLDLLSWPYETRRAITAI